MIKSHNFLFLCSCGDAGKGGGEREGWEIVVEQTHNATIHAIMLPKVANTDSKTNSFWSAVLNF